MAIRLGERHEQRTAHSRLRDQATRVTHVGVNNLPKDAGATLTGKAASHAGGAAVLPSWIDLLNAYAPLTNRVVGTLSWPPDAAVILIVVFGMGIVARHFPRSEEDKSPAAIFSLAVFCAVCAWMLFGAYPMYLVGAVAEETTGLAGLLAVVAVVTAVTFR